MSSWWVSLFLIPQTPCLEGINPRSGQACVHQESKSLVLKSYRRWCPHWGADTSLKGGWVYNGLLLFSLDKIACSLGLVSKLTRWRWLPPLQCWDYLYVPPCLVDRVLGSNQSSLHTRPAGSHMSHSPSWRCNASIKAWIRLELSLKEATGKPNRPKVCLIPFLNRAVLIWTICEKNPCSRTFVKIIHVELCDMHRWCASHTTWWAGSVT